MGKSVYISGAMLCLEGDREIVGGILLENGKIKAIDTVRADEAKLPQDITVIQGEGLYAIPGFIDGHIHGANGADTMDATEEALDRIAQFLPQEGTTSFLATTITQSQANIESALQNVAEYQNKPAQAEMIGVHLEGPFVNPSKAGAQPVRYMTKPDLDLFFKWQKLSGNNIRTITLAPELDKDGMFISYLKDSGVNVSAGHTDAGFTGMKKAVEQGVGQITHLCNAMNGIHHRDVGAVGAAFLLNSLRAELISDGIHVAPEMLNIIFQQMGSERIILITDAMRAKGLPDGEYELGGQPVTVSGDRALLEDGTLAGSILNMIDAARRMLALEGVTWRDIVNMTSENPAKQIGIFDRKGSIREGKDADILLVDDHLNIKYTICRGHIAFRGK